VLKRGYKTPSWGNTSNFEPCVVHRNNNTNWDTRAKILSCTERPCIERALCHVRVILFFMKATMTLHDATWSLQCTNPHWARLMGYGLFSLCVMHKKGLCPSSGDINRLLMMIGSLVWCPGQNKRIAPLFLHGCRKRRLKD
jgi:hypothetical protein